MGSLRTFRELSLCSWLVIIKRKINENKRTQKKDDGDMGVVGESIKMGKSMGRCRRFQLHAMQCPCRSQQSPPQLKEIPPQAGEQPHSPTQHCPTAIHGNNPSLERNNTQQHGARQYSCEGKNPLCQNDPLSIGDGCDPVGIPAQPVPSCLLGEAALFNLIRASRRYQQRKRGRSSLGRFSLISPHAL